LYRNNGNGTFTDVSHAAGFGFVPNFATGVNWIDYNLDGRLDLFIANRDAPNGLFRNNGNGTFTDYALASGMFDDRDSDGSTVGDYDNDGDPDIYVVNGVSGYGTPNFLFRNNLDPDAGGPHWLKVKLVGVLSNQSAIGAEVRVYGAGPLQTRQFAGSSGYMSQDALEALFGFGGYLGTVTVEVQWPSGVVDTLPGVALDQSVTVVESSPYLHDMAMVSLLPEGETPAGIAIEPMATVRNLGQFPETGAGVRCRILQGGSTLYNVNLTTGTIEPAAWGVLTFPAYTPPSEGEYTLTCSVTVSGDERAPNNSLSDMLVVTEQIADA